MLPLSNSTNTPIDAPPDDMGNPQYCGRAVFSDFHVTTDALTQGNDTFPGACVTPYTLSDQEKALAFYQGVLGGDYPPLPPPAADGKPYDPMKEPRFTGIATFMRCPLAAALDGVGAHGVPIDERYVLDLPPGFGLDDYLLDLPSRYRYNMRVHQRRAAHAGRWLRRRS